MDPGRVEIDLRLSGKVKFGITAKRQNRAVMRYP